MLNVLQLDGIEKSCFCPNLGYNEFIETVTDVRHEDHFHRNLKELLGTVPGCRTTVKSLAGRSEKANWQSPMEIKELYRSASILKNSRVVFNIKGNDYRLVTSIFYAAGWVYIKFIGTHKQYDKIDVNTVEIREVTK